MTRCPPASTLRATPQLYHSRNLLKTGLLTAALLLPTFPAMAQMQPLLTIRNFPANVQRATMQVLQPPMVLLNDKMDQLSPGSRIRGTNNMLVLSGALVGQNLIVNYVREPQGLIHEVWILNEAEALTPAPRTPNSLQP